MEFQKTLNITMVLQSLQESLLNLPKRGFRTHNVQPGYPQSNGLAEKTVKTAKSTLTKARRDNRDLTLAILEQRTTPIHDIGSPAQLSMGRRLR